LLGRHRPGGRDGAGQGIARLRDRIAAVGVTIFWLWGQKMVGPRRPLRRSVPLGMLGRNEQLIPVVGETGREPKPLCQVRRRFTAPLFNNFMRQSHPGRAGSK